MFGVRCRSADPKGLKALYPPHELDGLQFAAELHLQLVAQDDPIGTGHRQRLQGARRACVFRSGEFSRSAVIATEGSNMPLKRFGVGGSKHRRRDALAVGFIAEVAVQSQSAAR